MNKVLLTKAQAKALASLLEQANGNKDLALKQVSSYSQEKRLNKKFPSLKDLDVTDVNRALYLGYDVAPTFEIDDWVVHANSGSIRQVTGFANHHLEVSDGENRYIWDEPFVRHATPEEISEEQERRW